VRTSRAGGSSRTTRSGKLALEYGPAGTGFSRATLANGLDAFFAELTAENFRRLIEQDLGHVERLDEVVSSAAGAEDTPRIYRHIVGIPGPRHVG
jgi:hypothetical protein